MLKSKIVWVAPLAVMLCSTLFALPAQLNAKEKRSKDYSHAIFDSSKKTRKTKSDLGFGLKGSGYASFRFLSEENISLDARQEKRSTTVGGYLGFYLSTSFSDRLSGFAQIETDVRQKTTQSQRYAANGRARIKEANLSFALNDQSSFTVGRMRFSDTEKWVADSFVDGLHFGFKSQTNLFEVAALRSVSEPNTSYGFLHFATYDHVSQTGGYLIGEQKDQEQRLHLTAYTKRKVNKSFRYSVQFGLVGGDLASTKQAAFGLDARATYSFSNSRFSPQITAGLAMGSEGFVQTGLQSNKTYDGGQTQFNRYGFAYQPQLTNMTVLTIGAGIRPSRKLSVDLIAHLYAQTSPSSTAPTARVSGSLSGASSHLGSEISLVGGWRPNKKTKIEFGAGLFKPGPAYNKRSPVKRIYFGISTYF